MEDTSLRRTLIRIWPLLYSATYRLLDPAEVGEVRRLTRILQARLNEGTGDDGVLQRFLEQIHDSGVLAGKRAASSSASIPSITGGMVERFVPTSRL